MNVTCPGCGMHGPIDAFTAPGEAGQVAQLMGRVPPEISDLVLRYVGLFAPTRYKMTAGRGRRLLGELVPMIEARSINHLGRDWAAPVAIWEEAINYMLDNRAVLKLPLRSHGYLLAVVHGLADKAEAAAEREIEKKKQTGAPPRAVAEPVVPTRSNEIFERIRAQMEKEREETTVAAPSAEATEQEKTARKEAMRQAELEIQQRRERKGTPAP